jgi:hypothetical protein
MAYVAHSHLRDVRDLRGAVAFATSPAVLGRSALLAVAAAAAILALSDGGAVTGGPSDAVVAKKADRLPVAPSAPRAERAEVAVDRVAGVTSVSRGTVADLSPRMASGSR